MSRSWKKLTGIQVSATPNLNYIFDKSRKCNMKIDILEKMLIFLSVSRDFHFNKIQRKWNQFLQTNVMQKNT